MNEKVVGVIGGLGPEAMIDFYNKLLVETGAATDQDHLHVILNSNPKVPDRQMSLAGTGPSSSPLLVETAQVLEGAGADFLVMTCNTAHAYEADIMAATTIPFISILDVSVAAAQQRVAGLRTVGILAASGCVGASLYQDRFAEAGIGSVVPSVVEQEQLMGLIYRIKAGDHAAEISTQMADLAERLIERGAEIILAACTEVPLALTDDDISQPLLDCTAALVDATLAFARPS